MMDEGAFGGVRILTEGVIRHTAKASRTSPPVMPPAMLRLLRNSSTPYRGLTLTWLRADNKVSSSLQPGDVYDADKRFKRGLFVDVQIQQGFGPRLEHRG